MLDESLKRLIQRELREIDALLSRADELLNIAENEEPSFERLAALAQILTSFYTGLVLREFLSASLETLTVRYQRDNAGTVSYLAKSLVRLLTERL